MKKFEYLYGIYLEYEKVVTGEFKFAYILNVIGEEGWQLVSWSFEGREIWIQGKLWLKLPCVFMREIPTHGLIESLPLDEMSLGGLQGL